MCEGLEEPTIKVPVRLTLKIKEFVDMHVDVARYSGNQRSLNKIGAIKQELEELLKSQCSAEELTSAKVSSLFEDLYFK